MLSLPLVLNKLNMSLINQWQEEALFYSKRYYLFAITNADISEAMPFCTISPVLRSFEKMQRIDREIHCDVSVP